MYAFKWLRDNWLQVLNGSLLLHALSVATVLFSRPKKIKAYAAAYTPRSERLRLHVAEADHRVPQQGLRPPNLCHLAILQAAPACATQNLRINRKREAATMRTIKCKRTPLIAKQQRCAPRKLEITQSSVPFSGTDGP